MRSKSMVVLLGIFLARFIFSSAIQASTGDTAMLYHFAVIGDFGDGSEREGKVAKLVDSWNPAFIVTLGDNNYFSGDRSQLQSHIGDFYCNYIYNPTAPANLQCKGKAWQDKENRFFPCPGNHDQAGREGIKPYVDYFDLPGDELNYEFVKGPIHFYSINDGPAGKLSCWDGPEAKWMKASLDKAKEPFKIVYFHHPPHSSGMHGSNKFMQWPFGQWGIDVVMCGHDHTYQRILPEVDKTNTNLKPVYVVNGVGGNELYNCGSHKLDESVKCEYCQDKFWGAMKVEVYQNKLKFAFYAADAPDKPMDSFEVIAK